MRRSISFNFSTQASRCRAATAAEYAATVESASAARTWANAASRESLRAASSALASSIPGSGRGSAESGTMAKN